MSAASTNVDDVEFIIASEAISSGALTRGQLRWNYARVHPDVYAPRGTPLNHYDRILGASLWSGGRGVVAGLSAAALHGVHAVPDATTVELIMPNTRAPEGISIRNEAICDDEVMTVRGMRVTTPARTALDLGRRLPRDEAVKWLDKLAAASALDDDRLAALLARYRNTRGIDHARTALSLRDAGARSPEETALRLLLRDAGLPMPEAGIMLHLDGFSAVLGVGWRREKVGISVPGTYRREYRVDEFVREPGPKRDDLIHRLGWVEMQTIDGEARMSLIHRVRSMRMARGGWG